MITELEKSQIRQIIGSPQWKTIENLANELCQKIREESIVQDTEWGTLKMALLNEGQRQGISRFFQELLRHVQ